MRKILNHYIRLKFLWNLFYRLEEGQEVVGILILIWLHTCTWITPGFRAMWSWILSIHDWQVMPSIWRSVTFSISCVSSPKTSQNRNYSAQVLHVPAYRYWYFTAGNKQLNVSNNFYLDTCLYQFFQANLQYGK